MREDQNLLVEVCRYCISLYFVHGVCVRVCVCVFRVYIDCRSNGMLDEVRLYVCILVLVLTRTLQSVANKPL